MTLRGGRGSRAMILKVATATGCEGEKDIIRIPNPGLLSETQCMCVGEKIIEQELILSSL